MSSVESASLLSSHPLLAPELRCVAARLCSSDDGIAIIVWDLATQSGLRQDRLERAVSAFVEKGYLRRETLWSCPCGATAESSEGVCPCCYAERSSEAVEAPVFYINEDWKQGRVKTIMRAVVDKPLHVFYSYSHIDTKYKAELDKHLEMLRKEGVITTWHDGKIVPGSEWEVEIRTNLEKADIVILLISVDFLNSSFCYDKELTRAMERHDRSDAVVIPVIIRTCDWKNATFGKLQGLPAGVKPVDSFRKRDVAWTEIAQGIRNAAKKLKGN
jgi:hypothetical protein